MDRPALVHAPAPPLCKWDKSRPFGGRKFALQNRNRHERTRKAFGNSFQAINHIVTDRIQRETLCLTNYKCRFSAQPKKCVALGPRSEIDFDFFFGVERQL